ncbi:MAG TPA: prepilin-type N-terminal cleavage/methylation domain-containing protein [Candidatus Ozemobacteraceae bacterium]|nr:prepilin-type N-terminal cleavage/methylation domain-containing protein [Candidatus Ozemobacteraceae bacterium]
MRNTDSRAGLTLIELMVCTIIIGVLAGTALPLSRNFIQGKKEELLRERLRELRQGIDRYHEKAQAQNALAPEESLYPTRLEDLVERRILRRLPLDPMTGRAEWGTRSTSDPLDAVTTDGVNVFDIHSLATGTAFDGTAYTTW